MKYTLTLLLLADVTKKASLPGRRVSLFALAEALCARKVKIDLLSRGSEFEGKYTALWPDVRTVSSETEDVFNSLIENNEKAMTELVNIAEEVRQLFMSMTEDENGAEEDSEVEKVAEDVDGNQTGSDSAESVQGNNGTQEYSQAELRHRLKPEKLEKKLPRASGDSGISGTAGMCGKTGASFTPVPPQDQSCIPEHKRRRAEPFCLPEMCSPGI